MYEALKKTAPDGVSAFTRLRDIVAILQVECPWDREQDHHSLRACLIEEAYETAEAIDKEDAVNLEEELGDVLLQVVFHGLLAEKEESFSIASLINQECEKMIRRHPHIFFSQATGESVDNTIEKWENIKRREHGQQTLKEVLDGVPKALPALLRAGKIQGKTRPYGLDWEDPKAVLEEVGSHTYALIEEGKSPEKEITEAQIGNLLFLLVAAARLYGISAERALEKTTDAFIGAVTDSNTFIEHDSIIDKNTPAFKKTLWLRALEEVANGER